MTKLKDASWALITLGGALVVFALFLGSAIRAFRWACGC